MILRCWLSHDFTPNLSLKTIWMDRKQRQNGTFLIGLHFFDVASRKEGGMNMHCRFHNRFFLLRGTPVLCTKTHPCQNSPLPLSRERARTQLFDLLASWNFLITLRCISFYLFYLFIFGLIALEALVMSAVFRLAICFKCISQ